MSDKNIAQAMKDEDVRENLTEEQKANLPQNPAGEVSDEQLDETSGGTTPALPFLPIIALSVASAALSEKISADTHCL